MIDHTGAEWCRADEYRLRRDARRYETYEHAVGLQLGLGAAVEYALDLGIANISACVQRHAERLRAGLAGLPGFDVHDLGRDRSGLVTFSHERIPATEIYERLDAERIHVSVSTPSSTLLDASARNLPDMVRASPHYYNSDENSSAS